MRQTVPWQGMKLHRWSIGPSAFLVSPERGARLMHWAVELGDGSFRDVIHWPSDAHPDNMESIRGGNPVLFPFSGRTFCDGKIHQWKAPDGRILPMPMHGIARQGQFEITRLDGGGFTAQLQPDDKARTAYPFKYDFLVSYRFEPAGFYVELTLKNRGRNPIPWSGGHHFYFTAPWTDGLTRRDYQVTIPAKKTWRQDTNGGLRPADVPPAARTLDDPALVDLIHMDLKGAIARLEETGGSAVEVRFAEKRPPPGAAIVTWTETPGAPYYCVEPWMGPPNAPELERGLHWVKPGKSETFVVEVRVA